LPNPQHYWLTRINPKVVPTFLVGIETKIGIGAEQLGIKPSDGSFLASGLKNLKSIFRFSHLYFEYFISALTIVKFKNSLGQFLNYNWYNYQVFQCLKQTTFIV
jgi:hypothetical protein